MPRFICADWGNARLAFRPSNGWGRDYVRFVLRPELLDFLPCDGHPSELVAVRRIQFSLANLLGSFLFAAIACGVVRLGFDWPGGLALPMPTFAIPAISCVGASIGTLLKRPCAGAIVGLSFGLAYGFVSVAVFLICGDG